MRIQIRLPFGCSDIPEHKVWRQNPMADVPIRVLFRSVWGLPFRQATEEERSEFYDQMGQ
jgi:hypothetical protein